MSAQLSSSRPKITTDFVSTGAAMIGFAPFHLRSNDLLRPHSQRDRAMAGWLRVP